MALARSTHIAAGIAIRLVLLDLLLSRVYQETGPWATLAIG
jgi:hypothetical protein